MNYKTPICLVCAVLVSACGMFLPPSDVPGGGKRPPLLYVKGDQVREPGGRPIMLRGVSFGNQVWQDVAVPRLHHSAVDYQRVADMGMNSVRFYLHHATFEDEDHPGRYKAEGWKWLDDNIAWAKAQDIYLILNMHVPPGGFQSNGEGGALWEQESAQQRFIDLWAAIAERYREEPTIAGYDLLNEPVVTESMAQWHTLADRTIKAVRAVDPFHILFVERVNAVAGEWKEDADRNQFLVNDPNVVYEFHFYKPFHFTHQGASWVDFVAEDTTYPDPDRVGVEWFLINWRQGTFGSPNLPEGDSDWTYYEGDPFTIKDPTMTIAKPALTAQRNSGKVYFDDIVLERLNPDGSVAEEIWRVDLDTHRGWFFWKKNGVGNSAVEATGHGDDASLSISGTDDDTNLSADIYMVRTEPGATYRLSGWMKGEQIPAGAVCQVRLDFLSAQVPLHGWDKAFLAQEIDAYLAWAKHHGVPLYLGEFGAIRGSFDEDWGGLRWVEDMLDLLIERNLHFSYHDYHESNFGIYFGDDTLPDPNNANTGLIDLLTNKLNDAR